MFGFFRHKQIDTNNINNFNSAIRVIKYYIQLPDWASAAKALGEISLKEKSSFDSFILNLNSDATKKPQEKEKIIKKEQKLYDERAKVIQKLKENLEKKKEVYLKKIESERFKIRFKQIEKAIDKLSGQRKTLEALSLLKQFLSENVDKDIATAFFNKEKKKIEKIYEKQRKYEAGKIKNNARYEALTLIGETHDANNDNNNKPKKEKVSIFKKIGNSFHNFIALRKKQKDKKLLDKINLILEEDDKIKRELAEKNLKNMHDGLIKEINYHSMIGYEIYGKILGANKISGDTFGLEETREKYTFYIGDATGHGVKAGFIITLLSQLFNLNYTRGFRNLVFEINNQLKQTLQSRNFITGIFFNIDKKTNELQYIGVGHEPMLVYRYKTKIVEKIIPGGLAIGIRKMPDESSIKVKDLKLEDGDILICYSDGLVEAKSMEGEYYGIKKLQETFRLIASDDGNIHNIYNNLMNDVQVYRGGNQFDDDLTIVLLKKNDQNDIIKKGDDYLKKIQSQEGLNASDLKKLEGKTKREAFEKAEEIKRKKDTKLAISNLKNLYLSGEIINLKEEAIRYIKEGLVDKKINFYLKKALENESAYKISQKEQKIRARYNVLEELYKKGDYDTIIREVEDIISKDGNV